MSNNVTPQKLIVNNNKYINDLHSANNSSKLLIISAHIYEQITSCGKTFETDGSSSFSRSCLE